MAEFVRVTVVGPEDSAADVTAPLGRPVAEVVDQVAAVLGLDPSDETGWQFASVAAGPLAAHGKLSDYGVVDGDMLYIVPAASEVAAPEIFSAIDVVADYVEDDRRMWTGSARHSVVVGYAGMLVVVAAVAFAVTGGLVAGACAAAMGAFILATYAAPEPARHLVWITPICFAASSAAVFHASPWPQVVLATVGGGLCGIAITTFVLSPARWAIVASSSIAGATAIAAVIAIRLGVNATALAAWISPVLIIGLACAGRLSVAWSGLGGVVARTEEESPAASYEAGRERPGRPEIVRRAVIATDLLDGIVWACCASAVGAVLVLAITGVWEQAAFGAYIGLAFLLRSRSFSEVRHVAPIIGVAVTSAFIVPVALIGQRIGESAPFITAAATMVIALLLGVIILFLGYFELPTVTGARLAQLWNVVDALVLLGLIPMLFWAQGIYQYILGTDLGR